MNPFNRPHIRIRQQGQTLIIALIILGVLLILGLVFLGLIDRNILNAARSQRRSEASDLAEAGVRYAHGQLVSSPLRADWRGVPTTLASLATDPDLTGDPDAYYLRPPSKLVNTFDLGGPDRLGPFVRVLFPGGRALVRVRYGASDASPTKLVAGGPLINPGSARAQIIIEAVGRTGQFIQSDPTTYSATGGYRFRNFANENSLTQTIGEMANADAQLPTSRRVVAYAPIGIIDAARFETNVFNSSAPIDLGIPEGLGALAYNDANIQETASDPFPTDVGSHLDMQLGTPGSVQVRSLNGSVLAGPGFGSLIVNGDLLVHGRLHAYLNRTLGDTIRVSGRISGASSDVRGVDPASLLISAVSWNGSAYAEDADKTFALVEDPTNLTTLSDGVTPVRGSFDSQTTAFSTGNGLVYDGSPRTDTSGFPSGVGALVPPSAQTLDPQTKLNGYVAVTRESGIASTGASGGNTGQYGHGGGIFVDNQSDRQEALDANGRAIVGSQQSLFDDWLNPNNGAPNSGWKGPFYVPRGAAVQLLPDGLSIQRDGSAPAAERTWKRPDGSDSGLTTIRYRFGRVGTQVYVVDTLTTGIGDINAAGLNFSLGTPFNGVLYFEGNVRVRGTIPTEVQMTLVSGATIYIDGPIVKGTTANEVSSGGLDPRFPGLTKGTPINGLPSATLMLMARDNVVVNTTMFFGPTAAQPLESVNDTTGSAGISPVRLRAAGGDEAGALELLADLALDPGTSTSPAAWSPYALTYRPWDATGNKMPTRLLLGSTMDDGTASASFLALNVNFGSPYPSPYGFNAADGLITNTAAAYTGQGTGTTPIYGLGAEPWQRYARFEIRPFTLIDDTATSPTYGRITQTNQGYSMFSDQNDLLIRPGAIAGVSANDTLVGRVAMTPADVRIEASIFAEEGSFFVIPGPWFNPNPNDTHVAYASRIAELTTLGMNNLQANAAAARERLEAYGTAPGVPFYGEPLDVKVNVVGSVAENLPPPASVQAEWQRKWGWIPRRESVSIDGVGVGIPRQHVPGEDPTYLIGNGSGTPARNFVPNLIIQYDPVLATGRTNTAGAAPIRVDDARRPLPPMPRLPVSPKLSYFGEL